MGKIRKMDFACEEVFVVKDRDKNRVESRGESAAFCFFEIFAEELL